MKIQVINNGSIYDVFVDGAWEVSRGSADNILLWLAEKTKDEPAHIEYVER